MTKLIGSTWDHARGYDPMVATAEAYCKSHPDVEIVWEKRTLTDFAEMSLPQLAERYDMIVLDHPWSGGCFAQGSLVPLDGLLDATFLADQAANSVGSSHMSYNYGGRQWALAIDAASQVSAYRPDLLEKLDAEIPQTWEKVFALASVARRKGMYICTPLFHIDCLPTFVTLCAQAGEPAFSGNLAVSRSLGREVLAFMARLLREGHPNSAIWNPPQALDVMSRTDEIAYSPLLFGYTNYSRPGFRPHLLRFCDIPNNAHGRPNGAIIGGAGLAVTSRCENAEVAADYAAFVASDEIQCGLFFDRGGQPGHRKAWLDARTNAEATGFFADTLATLDGSTQRPRYSGWINVQDEACLILHRFLTGENTAENTLEALDRAYGESLLNLKEGTER